MLAVAAVRVESTTTLTLTMTVSFAGGSWWKSRKHETHQAESTTTTVQFSTRFGVRAA
jgi:hypothetical protein